MGFLLAVVGLVLLLLGLTVANGALAWIEVSLALVLLVASFILRHQARRETLSRQDGD
ncbi:hypothetical protein ACFQZ4_05160 [Catellatospora coxensis]